MYPFEFEILWLLALRAEELGRPVTLAEARSWPTDVASRRGATLRGLEKRGLLERVEHRPLRWRVTPAARAMVDA